MKVAICIPRYGDTKGDFTISLAKMIAHSLSSAAADGQKLEIEIFSISSSDLPMSRAELLNERDRVAGALSALARQRPCLSVRALLRLLRHKLPVVGCNQPRRSEPTGPVAVKLNDKGEMEHVWTTAALAKRAPWRRSSTSASRSASST